jgi:hypothetical protein
MCSDNMSLMARELCIALDIDIPTMEGSLYEQDFSPTSAYGTSETVTEDDRDDGDSQVSA